MKLKTGNRLLGLRSDWRTLLVFVILCFIVVVGGSLYQYRQLEQIRRTVGMELETIADLKKRQIELWRNERMEDGKLIMSSVLVSEHVRAFLKHPERNTLNLEMKNYFNSITAMADHERVVLIDSRKRSPVLIYPEDGFAVTDIVKEAIEKSREEQGIVLSDFIQGGTENSIRICMVIPIKGDTASREPVGFLLIVIDPYKTLYPMIQSWPTVSDTAESLLVEKAGDSVLYLNELRHMSGTALKLMFPIRNHPQLPAAQAVLGKMGFITGYDYRSVKVFAYVQTISNSSWRIVVKKDVNEAFRQLNGLTIGLVLLLLLIIVSSGFMLLYLTYRQNFINLLTREEIRESESRFRALFLTMAQGVVYMDKTGSIISVNPAAEKILGLTLDQIKGMTAMNPEWKAIHEDGSEFHGEDHPSSVALKTGKPVYDVLMGVYQPILKSYRWILINAVPEFQPGESTPYQVYTTFTDITERKLLEEARRETEARFQALFNDMTEGVCLQCLVEDENGKPVNYRIMDVNRQYEKILGINREAVVGKLSTEAYQVDTPPYLEEYSKAALSMVPYFFETYFPPMDKYFYISVSPIGKGFFATLFFDISNLKKTEEELRKHKDNLEQMVQNRTAELTLVNNALKFEIQERKKIEESLRLQTIIVGNMAEGVVIIRVEDTTIVYANPRFERMFGYETGELNGKDVKILHPDKISADDKCSAESIIRLLKENGEATYEAINRKKDGSVFWCRANTTTIDHPLHGVVWVAVQEDISDQKKAEELLIQANEELEKRVRLRTNELASKNKELEQIIYVTSHDLRSPLVNAQGFSKELNLTLDAFLKLFKECPGVEKGYQEKLSKLEEDVREELQFIHSSIKKMDILLSGLLKISRLGRIEIKKEKINMKELVETVCQGFEFRFKTEKIQIKIGSIPPCVGDKTQIDQVLSNLIDNAIKYLDVAKPPLIEINGWVDNGNAVYCVEDNGIGIQADHQEKVFEIFHRLNPTLTEGEGLGLSIVKRIVDKHMGRVWLESEAGRGSRFYFSIPQE